ncbi:hypothetical protein OOK29_09740 [Streptomyces phaeochromogenes]|uniref:hypothetical protein n=1 Tax=Streptomyces phaeochromogenes TaxID=1923 RepID=UPI0022565418|nr:hypothetical protein [Streptomyces phaeochromogenes]MCX5598419.1 hypothetical protein [Streptomyces phaeochromogenes]
MDEVVYMVRTKSRASCQRELDLICERMGAVAVTDPTDAAGARWVARAVPRITKAPADGDRGPGVG